MSILNFFTVKRIAEIILVAIGLWLLSGFFGRAKNYYTRYLKPLKLIAKVNHMEGSRCEIKEHEIIFSVEYDGNTFTGKSPIDYEEIWAGNKTLTDFADVAYNEMHQSIDRYLEKKQSNA